MTSELFMGAATNARPAKSSYFCGICHVREICITSDPNGQKPDVFKPYVHHRPPLERGERLYVAGDRIHSIFVLHSGAVKCYIDSEDGHRQITNFCFPGDIFGIHGMENQVHSDTVEMLETSSVCEIKLKDLGKLDNNTNGTENRLLLSLFREMSHEQEMMLVLGKLSAQSRIAHFLLDLSRRMEKRGLSPTMLKLPMTRHDIANYLCLALETVSRNLTLLQASSAIAVEYRGIRICDRELLKSKLSGER